MKQSPKEAATYAARAQAYMGKKDYGKALDDYNTAIQLEPKQGWLYANRASAHAFMKNHAKSVEDCETALRLDPKSSLVNNAFAWVLATCPEAKIRDGKKAIELARKACELSAWKNWAFLDTLAAAYAEAGQFEQAIQWQKKALAMPEAAGPDADDARARLKMYEQRQPYREK